MSKPGWKAASAGLLIGLSVSLLVLWRGPGSRALLDPPVLVAQVQRLRELVSVKYTVQRVVALEEKKVPFGSEKILLFVQAEVLSGVDLSELEESDFRQTPAGGWIVSLPPPRILHVTIDDRQTKVWDRQITWWTPWVPYNTDLERQARLEARRIIEDSAREMGILKEARRNAEIAIRAILAPAGISAVAFVEGS